MNAWQMPEWSKYLQRNLVLDDGHLLDQVLKRSGILPRTLHKEFRITSRTRCCRNSQKADIIFSVQRLFCPCVSSKATDMEHCQYTSLQIIRQLKLFFAFSFLSISSAFTEQLQTYVRNSRAYQDRSGEPDLVMVQSIVLGEIKAETPLQNENYSKHQILWQQYMEQIESFSQESKVSGFCMEAGFMRIVEVGQHFMTKNNGDFK